MKEVPSHPPTGRDYLDFPVWQSFPSESLENIG